MSYRINALKNNKFINETYTKFKWRERRVSYGRENADKTFYVIRRANGKSGLFSYIMTNAGGIAYAVNKGIIPIIDMQNEKNMYINESQVGYVNAWEFFFEQPYDISLDDIISSKNVILSYGLIDEKLYFPGNRTLFNEDEFLFWHTIFDKYIRIKKNLLDEFEVEKQNLFKDLKMLGVLARGTDYTRGKPQGHTIQPSAEKLIYKINDVMEKYKCHNIYLATEDKDIYDCMKDVYEEKLIAPDVKRFRVTENQNINDTIIENYDNIAEQGKEYLKSIWLLSRCNCFVGGNVSGSLGAMLMSKGYEYSYIFDLGLY